MNMKAHIITPDGPVFEGEVSGVQLPGYSGGFEVRKGHAPFVSRLKTGKMVVKKEGSEQLEFAVSGGFTEVSADNVTVLAEEALSPDQIDLQSETDKEQKIREQLKGHLIDSVEHNQLSRELDIVRNRIRMAHSAG